MPEGWEEVILGPGIWHLNYPNSARKQLGGVTWISA